MFTEIKAKKINGQNDSSCIPSPKRWDLYHFLKSRSSLVTVPKTRNKQTKNHSKTKKQKRKKERKTTNFSNHFTLSCFCGSLSVTMVWHL